MALRDLLRLYFIPPEVGAEEQLSLARAALEGGATCLQLRSKGAAGRALFDLALAYRALAAEFSALLIVNDRADLAMACGAHGVHVGRDDLPAAAVRRIVGAGLILGVSASGVDEATTGVRAGADYIGAGPVFPTPSKDDASHPMGLAVLRDIASASQVPVVAIGGIDHERVGVTMAAGAAGIAVISAIAGVEDPREAARALRQEVDLHEGRREESTG